jgi:hypothetical protein
VVEAATGASSEIRASYARQVTGPWSTPVLINFTNQSQLLFGGGTVLLSPIIMVVSCSRRSDNPPADAVKLI